MVNLAGKRLGYRLEHLFGFLLDGSGLDCQSFGGFAPQF